MKKNMSHFPKNDSNFHGARSKTRTENRSSKKQDIAPKNYANNDDGWGSVPKRSGDTSNCDDGWGHIPQDTSTSDNALGQDRPVSGKAGRNRQFRSNSRSTFHVPDQSRPNWDEVEEFPALGSRTGSSTNVWEKRKEKFEELKAIEPTNQTEEERMIQKAIELSKMEINNEEEKRRQLEEEYQLQTQLLAANPDLFVEFRLGEGTDEAIPDKFVAESCGASDGHAEESPNDEISKDSADDMDGWDSSSEKKIKKKDLKKDKKNYESPKEEDNIPQLKQDSWSQPITTAAGKSSYSGARPKISKVVDMFGGWGTAKPAATAFHQDKVKDTPDHRSSKWDTVDVEFAKSSSIRKPIAAKPTKQLSSPDSPEVKIDNTFSNWNTVKAETASKLSGWDKAEVETANKLSNWHINETETATKLCTWDTPEKENCKVPSVESHRQVDIIKVTSKDENRVSDSLETENSSKTSDNFELNSENYEKTYASSHKEEKLVSQSEQKDSKSKEYLKTKSTSKSLLSKKDMKETDINREIISSIDSGHTLEKDNKHEYQLHSSEQSQDISPKMFATHVQTKAKIDSLEGKCFDSPSSVENDYAFFLNSINPNYKSSTTQLEIPNQESKIQTEDLHSRNSSSFSKTEQLEIPQLGNQTASSLGFPEGDASNDPLIPGPHPLYTNYKEGPSLPAFDGFPDQVGNYDLPLTRNGESHIDAPKAAVPTPEVINPVFIQQPMMTPLMNPTLIRGMNPMLQQMLILANPFFVQQLQQMSMFYSSLGMPLEAGMPMYPQPMTLLNFPNNPNPQVFGNVMENWRPSPAGEEEAIPPPCPTASSPPGMNTSLLLTEDPSEIDQSSDDWLSFLSSDSSLIPPPKPTPVSAPENLSEVTHDTKIRPASSSLGVSMNDEGLTSINKHVSPIPGPCESSNRSPEVPHATGWGDIKVDSKSNEASGWCDDVDGWGSDNASTARSMRNPSRHIAGKKTACRQPVSQPNLGRTKT